MVGCRDNPTRGERGVVWATPRQNRRKSHIPRGYLVVFSVNYFIKLPRANTTRTYICVWFVAFWCAFSCFVASTYPRTHKKQRAYFSVLVWKIYTMNWTNMTKIGENYHATFKNPTNHGGVCGIFVSKNTTQNLIFFENPTPRGGILKYHESDPTRGEISI